MQVVTPMPCFIPPNTIVDDELQDDDEAYLNGMVPVGTFPGATGSPADSIATREHLTTLPLTRRAHRWWVAPLSTGLWQVHDGFNASVNLSAFTSLGHHHFSGTAVRIDLLYATSINSHLSLGVGGYLTNMNTNYGNYLSGGFNAWLNYRFNDHWEAYVYAQANLVNTGSLAQRGMLTPYCYDLLGTLSDRIGIGVRYHLNDATFFELQFDVERCPMTFHSAPITPQQHRGEAMNKTIESRSPLPPTAAGQR